MKTLFRAIVSLPQELCLRGRPLQERIVFFEAEYDHVQRSNVTAGRALEQLLTLAWGIDATGWGETGLVYNFSRERALLDDSYGDDGDGDKRLLEIGCGPEGISYAKAADIDLFVTPRNRARLDAALRSAEEVSA